MKNTKNVVIAILTGLLALSLFTQPAQSAGKSKEAKASEYTACLINSKQLPTLMDAAIALCKKYQP
jgi:hypothetical protein